MSRFFWAAAMLALGGCVAPRQPDSSLYVLTYLRPEPGLFVCGSYVGSPAKTAGEPDSKVFVAIKRLYGTEIMQMRRHEAVVTVDEQAEQVSLKEERGPAGPRFVFIFTTKVEARSSAFCLTGE